MATFCDLGMGIYDIEVGANECTKSVVLNVRIGYQTERNIKAFVNGCPHPMIPPSIVRPNGMRAASCRYVMRVEDEKGEPLGGVDVKSVEKIVGTTDMFGRLWYPMGFGESKSLIFVHKEYARLSVSLNCDAGSEGDRERKVVLRRTGK